MQPDSLEKVSSDVVTCRRCPRLRNYCEAIAREKKREFREWEYWGKPVPGFGDAKAKIWIVGLAPAAHGGNRTGRMFTGDSSGNWLYRALFETGFASQAESHSLEDGQRLRGVYISAAGRCAPPNNKPTPEELAHCAPFLRRERELLADVKLIIALGAIGFTAILDFLSASGEPIARPRPKFGHDILYEFSSIKVLCSYHPSRQNTQTGRLTWEMWKRIFERAAALTKKSSRG